MKDRRKTQREGVKKIDVKSNKVSKIIFYKQIIFPVVIFAVSILTLLFVLGKELFDVYTLNNKLSNIKEQITDIKNKEQNIKKQNMQISSKLAQTDTNMIDTKEVDLLINKIIQLLKVKRLITDAKILSIENDSTYQNVANLTVSVQTGSKLLDINLIKDIIKLVLKKVVYLKSISVQNGILHIQIYKKVTQWKSSN